MTKNNEDKPDWVNYEKDEVEKLIKKLEKEGHNQSKIGIILRDQYGIPNVKKFNMRVSRIVEKKEVPEDMYNLMVRVVNLHGHMNKSKRDSTSKHGLEKLESQIRRLGKYYIKKGRLPKNWKYSIESAKLIVK